MNIPSPLPTDKAPLLARAAQAYNEDGDYGVRQFIKILNLAEREQLRRELKAGAIVVAVNSLAASLGIQLK